VTAGFALLGLSLLLVGQGRGSPVRPAARHRGLLGARRSRVLGVAGAVAVVGVCVGTAGLRVGAALSLVLVPVAGAALHRVEQRRSPPQVDPLLPRALDLAASALRAGVPVSTALAVAAPAAGAQTARLIEMVAGLLRLGALPAEAWADVADHPQLGRLARIARLGDASGIRLAGMWEDTAGELRAELRVAAGARAARAGVLAMAPLGLCFLPAFLCLGVVPDALALFGTSWDPVW
jgi:Flp pilus assembly protein TadB